MRRPSAGTRSPASTSTMSPGTRSVDSTSSTRPARRTRAWGTWSCASASTLACALSSWSEPITTLNVTSSADDDAGRDLADREARDRDDEQHDVHGIRIRSARQEPAYVYVSGWVWRDRRGGTGDRVGWQEPGPRGRRGRGGQHDHGGGVGPVGEVGDEDRAGDRRAEGRAEVGDAARQPGDLALPLLGKLDCTTLTEGVSMTPTPKPIRRSPGANAQALGEPLTRASRTTIPAIVTTKPATISVRCGVPLRRGAPRQATTPGCRQSPR